jgi:protein-S-isoprenylcysteine O-methyltransferase Ste14
MDTGPPEDEPDLTLFREERARQERAKRRDRASWAVVGWVMAGALALLGYDSGGAAFDAHRDGRPWAYPACVSAGCLLVLLWLLVRMVRRRTRDRISHRGPG